MSEGSTGSGQLNKGDRASKPHSPSLRVARGDHHHLMFPVGVNRQGVRWTFIRHCPREDSGWGGKLKAQLQGMDTAVLSPLTLAPDFPVAPRGPR